MCEKDEIIKTQKHDQTELIKEIQFLQAENKRFISYLNFLGIDPYDGSPTAEVIVAMRIQELQRENAKLHLLITDVKEKLEASEAPFYAGMKILKELEEVTIKNCVAYDCEVKK